MATNLPYIFAAEQTINAEYMDRTLFFVQLRPFTAKLRITIGDAMVLIFASLVVVLLWRFLPLLAALVNAALAILNHIDKQAMLILNYDGSSTADSFWYLYSQKLTWIPLELTALAAVFAMHPGKMRERLVFVVSFIVVLTLCDQLSSGVIKPLVGRLRPSHDPSVCNLLHYVNDYRGGMNGFVSSHAANTVGMTTMLIYVFRNRLTRFVLIAFTVMMCYSRIYLGVHFLGDIVCGALLGWSIAAFVLKRFGKVINSYQTDRQPTFMLSTFTFTMLALAAAASIRF